MASSRFVLKGIEDMLKEEVKFFSMVRQNGERMYICLGKRALYLLDFEPPMQQQFYFAWIQTVIIDRDNLLLFQIDMTEGREPLILESFERERLCDELAICWKADFMFRKWSWQTFPLKRGQCDVARRERTALEFTTAPEKMQKIEFGGYLLFADDAYRGELGADGQPSGIYRLAGRERVLKVLVIAVEPVATLGRREKDSLRLKAEQMARGQSADAEMLILRSEQARAQFARRAIRSARNSAGARNSLGAPPPTAPPVCGAQYHKRMNLMGDLAAWGCWAVHLRTPALDVGVLAVRRKYLPPAGDAYQDIFIVQTDDVEAREDPALFMQGLERQVDTLSPLVRVPFYDDTITRIKADALLYDEDSFSWFHAEGIVSCNVDAARAFYKSVAQLLVKEKSVDLDMRMVEPGTLLLDDPFRVVQALWEDAPGLNDGSDAQAWRNWRRRVARYLCWAIDGGLHPGELSLEMLVACERKQQTSLRARDILQRLFEFFMHLSTEAQPYELDSSMLADKVGDADFMSSFDMNKRPMLVLLERGYIQRSLEEEVPPKYVPFLAQMLSRPFETVGPELLVAICNQIALMSQVDFQREKLMAAHVLLPLIELLRSDHDVLLLSVAKALINLSSGNDRAKDSIVNEGGVRSLIPHLLNKTEEITRAFCVLLKNCLTAPELRDRVVNDGAVSPIVKLLHRSEIIGAQRSPATVAAAASALWNLSAHEGAKKMVIREKGVEALVMQLNEAEDRDAWQKCAGCLMVLAANSQQVKHLVGDEDGIRALCEIVKQSLTDGAVLKAALGALSVLSSDERNLANMRAEGLEPICERLLTGRDKEGAQKDPRLLKFAETIYNRLASN